MQAGHDRHMDVLDALNHVRARPPAYGDFLGAWRRAERHTELALADWHSAPSALKREAHAVYTAALDQEAQAAEVLRRAPARLPLPGPRAGEFSRETSDFPR